MPHAATIFRLSKTDPCSVDFGREAPKFWFEFAVDFGVIFLFHSRKKRISAEALSWTLDLTSAIHFRRSPMITGARDWMVPHYRYKLCVIWEVLSLGHLLNGPLNLYIGDTISAIPPYSAMPSRGQLELRYPLPPLRSVAMGQFWGGLARYLALPENHRCLVAQCSATPATVAATPLCSAAPFQTQISVRHLPGQGGARCDTKIFRGCSATPVLHLQNAVKSRKSAATRVARHV